MARTHGEDAVIVQFFLGIGLHVESSLPLLPRQKIFGPTSNLIQRFARGQAFCLLLWSLPHPRAVLELWYFLTLAEDLFFFYF